MKKAKPSLAQAKLLAQMFAGQEIFFRKHGGNSPPTFVAVVRWGWVSETGAVGTYPNGSAYHVFKINEDGIDALEAFLFACRCKRAA
jgi:hypothetical protein